MNRIKHRAIAVIVLAALVFAGLGIYFVRFLTDGEEWASFVSNGNAFSSGKLKAGTVTDRNGVVLWSASGGEASYADDETVRKSTLHLIGDAAGNIGTGTLKNFSADIIGYDPIMGIYSFDSTGKTLELSIDSELNAAAYNALDGKRGAVAVMNYETGEIICMVSTPTFDPEDPPEISESDTSGVYLNRALSSAYTPGSVFKLVTLAAAIENIPDLYEREFHCEGALSVGNDSVVCTRAHGDMKIEDALAVSCNCVFAQLTLELSGEKIREYAEEFGLTVSQKVDGISTASGKYDIALKNIDLAWSGVGQYNDLVNPTAMMRFVAAIANGGMAPEMTQLKGGSSREERIMSADTAEKLSDMMSWCVTLTYGEENFPGLELCAKSGTAEVGAGLQPNAWFVGFLKNSDAPLAFAVVIEEGGWGSLAAGSVASEVLRAAIG